MAQLNFYLRVRSSKHLHPIQGRVSHQGEQKPFTTPFKASEKGWDKKMGNVANDPETREELFKLKDYVEYDLVKDYQRKHNTRLEPDMDYIMAKIKDRLTPGLYTDPDLPITTYINMNPKDDFADFMDQFAEVNKTNFRYDTIQVYKSCAKYLRYFASKINLSLEPKYLDNAFFAKFTGFLTTEEIKKGTTFLYKNVDYTFDRVKPKMQNPTAEKYYTKISSTIKFFDLEDVIKIKKKKIMGGLTIASPDVSEMPFLDYEELMEVWNFDCSRYEDKMLHYEAARDCFIFCAFTGLRHNELYDLKDNNIHSKSLPTIHRTLSYVPEKNGNGVRTETLFTEVCTEIVDRWSKRKFTVRKKPKGGHDAIFYPDAILPVKSCGTFNKLLHVLLRDIGREQMRREYGERANEIDFLRMEPVGFYEWQEITRFSSKDKLTTRKRRFEHITFHASRHSFAFWLLSMEIPLEKISRLLNHKTIKTTQRYYTHWKNHELAYNVTMKIGGGIVKEIRK